MICAVEGLGVIQTLVKVRVNTSNDTLTTMADKKVTFMFDKYQNEVDLFRYDRTEANHLGIGTEESIAKLVVLLAKHIKNMDNGKTLYVTFEEGD